MVLLLAGIIGFIVGQISMKNASTGVGETARVHSATAGSTSAGNSVGNTSASNSASIGNQDDAESTYDLKNRAKYPSLTSKEDFANWTLENTSEDEEYINWRWDLSVDLREWQMITNERMLEAFLRTPRESFCREWNLHKAYLDIWMNIGYGVTITDPSVVSRMTETILPEIDQKVLEIGTGSGYQAAILSNLSNHVYTIEIIKELAIETDALLKSLVSEYPEYRNIKRKVDDGYYGWAEHAPFDRIIVTCSIDHIPPILIKQLAPDGIMIIPVGPPGTQTLLKVTKRINEKNEVTLERADVWGSPVTFVPFTDKSGKKHTLGD
jgi:protein-L-isoaspartate(D-aspartate) O-methyltransferase